VNSERVRFVARRVVVFTNFAFLPIAAFRIRTAPSQSHLLLACFLGLLALAGLPKFRLAKVLFGRPFAGVSGALDGVLWPRNAAAQSLSISNRRPASFVLSGDQSLARVLDAHPKAYSETLTDALFRSSLASIIITDASGKIVRLNPAAARLTLVDEHAALNEHYQTFYCEHSKTARLVSSSTTPGPACTMCSADTPHSYEPGSKFREWSYIRKDNSRVPVNIFVHQLRSPDGQISGYVETAVELTSSEHSDALKRSANYDQLTGLANRYLLTDEINQLMSRLPRANRKVAVFMLGIDNFKRINESLGHESGDFLLKWIATQLQSCVRTSDIVARVGGDEFAVLMPEFRSFADADRCAHLMLQVVAEPVIVAGCELRVTASVGYCVYPDAAATAADLLLRADIAMHEAKSTGRNICRSFSPDMHKEATERLELEGELRHALVNGELALHYQPQIDCGTKSVVGMEMLLRWNSRKRGSVPPNVFIPIAEKAGLLDAMGAWSLRQACKDSMSLQAELGRSLMLAVNLSPSQLCQPDLVAVLKEALEDSGLPAHQLEIEITEQVLMTTNAPVMQTLRDLRDVGVRVAIDDFGTGYSSFSYIMQYHFDRLKIDRSFVSRSSSDPTAAAIVRTMIAMAHGMNLDVVAEGVETADQMKFLQRRKCDQVQGFLFSKAVSVEEFTRVVNAIERDHRSSTCSIHDAECMLPIPPAQDNPMFAGNVLSGENEAVASYKR
jgi:diguanylate cyclase (GGDEF)-like protein